MNSIYNRHKTLIILLLIGLLGVGAFFIYRTQPKTTQEADVAEEARKEAFEIKKGLSKHLILPEGEEPDIRKINQKLDDPFFANATIGDYLIIFYKSRIAYIYSPEKDIIINAGVVFVNQQQATSTKR